MRKRKLIVIALLSAFSMSAEAQIVSSQSNQVIVTEYVKEKKVKEKKPWVRNWYLKVGASLDMLQESGYDSKIGYEAAVGLLSPLGEQGAYWGTELGALSNIYEDFHSSHGCVSIFANPYIGWRFTASGSVAVAPYVGPYVRYAFDGHPDRGAVVGFGVGANLWINNKYAIGVAFRGDAAGNDWSDKNNNINLNFYITL